MEGVAILARIAELLNAVNCFGGSSPFAELCKWRLGYAKCGPIGVDLDDDSVKIAQLGSNGKEITLVAGGSKSRPADVKPGSVSWQRWAVEAIRELTVNFEFNGKAVVGAMPASDVFIDHIKVPKVDEDKLEEAIFSRIKHKLPIKPQDAVIKYVPTEQDNALVMAIERRKIDRHLAIYEKAQLAISSIGTWPVALTNSYVRFFGRRKSDIEAVVCLLDIGAGCTNFVICRHRNLLFARSIPIGVKQLESDEMITRLVLELTGCRGHFSSMHKGTQVERLVFLSGLAVDKDICATIAKQLEMPAQVGDCLVAVKIEEPSRSGIDRRGSQISWATAFGLSLS